MHICIFIVNLLFSRKTKNAADRSIINKYSLNLIIFLGEKIRARQDACKVLYLTDLYNSTRNDSRVFLEITGDSVYNSHTSYCCCVDPRVRGALELTSKTRSAPRRFDTSTPQGSNSWPHATRGVTLAGRLSSSSCRARYQYDASVLGSRRTAAVVRAPRVVSSTLPAAHRTRTRMPRVKSYVLHD